MDVKRLNVYFIGPQRWLGEGLSSLNIQYKDYSFTDILLAALSVDLLEATEYFKFLIIYFLYNFICRMFGSTCIILYTLFVLFLHLNSVHNFDTKENIWNVSFQEIYFWGSSVEI